MQHAVAVSGQLGRHFHETGKHENKVRMGCRCLAEPRSKERNSYTLYTIYIQRGRERERERERDREREEREREGERESAPRITSKTAVRVRRSPLPGKKQT
jgi:hypothetical protein